MPKQIWRAAALATVLVLAGCGKSEPQLIEAAKAELAKNDRAAATIQLKNALEKNPKSAEARFLLGKVLLESGSAAPAEVELQRALELGYPAAQVTPLLARSVLAQGKPARVTATWADIAWPDADATASLKTTVAAAWLAQGSLDDAATAVDTALRLVPTYAPAILLKARLVARGGDVAGALARVDALLARDANNAEAWTLRGDLLLARSKDHAPAIEAYRKAVQIDPHAIGAHSALITLHLVDRDLDAAAKQLAALKAVAPKGVVTVMLEGQIALAKGDLQHAREQFQLVLRAAPNYVAALQAAGRTELGLNALEQAESHLAKAMQLAPEALGPRLLLAQTYIRQNQPGRAQSVLAPLLDRPQVPNEVLMEAAQAYLLGGDAAKAETLFQRAAKAAPDDPKLRTALALSHLARGASDSALTELQSISASDSGVSADLALISALIRQGKNDAALRAIATLAKKRPTQPLADQLRGQLLARMGDPAGARKSFEQALAKDATYYPAVAALAGMDMMEQHADQAKARLGEFLKKSPGQLQAMMALAEIGVRTQAPRSEVSALIEAAIKAHPSALAPRLALVDYHLLGGDGKAALAAVQAGLTAMPDRLELIERLGRAQFMLKDWEQAKSAFGRLVTLQPKVPVGYLGLADVAQAQGDTAGAAREVRRALEVAPDSLAVQRAAMEAALRDKHPEMAMSYAKKIQSRQPDAAAGWLYEGEIALNQKQWPAAEAAFRKALGKAGGATAPARVHAVLVAQGKQAEADQFSAGWRRDHPNDTVFLFYLGDEALARGDQAGAERWYRAVIDKNPGHALAMNNVAWLMLMRKEPGALAMAQKAAQAAPQQPQVLDTLAQAQAADGQVAQAVQTVQVALGFAPKDPAIRLHYAKYLIAAGNKRQAKAELDRLAALGKDFNKQDEVAALLKELVPG